MAVLSVDLAHKNYSDIGVVLLRQSNHAIICEPIRLAKNGAPSSSTLATWLNNICQENAVRFLVLDGPQGWKADDNGLQHSRLCERELNTPAKTGRPFEVKPNAYTAFVKFSIEVYDALCTLGWKRVCNLQMSFESPDRWLIESFPLSAWKELGLAHLPSKRKCRGKNLDIYLSPLMQLFPLKPKGAMTHDEVQAAVAGLAGLAIENGEWQSCRLAGVAPTLVNGHWREGLIVNPTRPPNKQ
jgi:hypothetical protein